MLSGQIPALFSGTQSCKIQPSESTSSFLNTYINWERSCLTAIFYLHVPCSTKFLREFNFANGRFFVFCGNKFLRLGKTGFSCWEFIFAIFRKSPSIWNYNILLLRVKTIKGHQMQVNMGSWVNEMQMYNTFSVNQWSTFRRSFSLRPLKLLTATYCSVPMDGCSGFFLFRFVSRRPST